jgi:hypothetical protein
LCVHGYGTGEVVIYRIGKSGHEFLHFSMAEGTMDVRIPVEHQFVKAIVTVVAVIFIYGHRNSPDLLGFIKKISFYGAFCKAVGKVKIILSPLEVP